MSLNVKVDAKPTEIRQAAGWLGDAGRLVHDSAGAVRTASGLSESGWEGQAGPAFRETMGKVGPGVDNVAEQARRLHEALDTHADDIDTVRARMEQARSIARQAGLRVTRLKIFDPGPPPPEPPPFPKDHLPTPPEHNAYVAMQDARYEYMRKLKAFYECTQIVNEAREIEHESQSRLHRIISGIVKGAPFTIASFASGLAGAILAQNSKLSATSNSYKTQAALWAKELGKGGIDINDPHWRTAAIQHTIASVEAREAARKVNATRLQRAVNRLPDPVQRALRSNIGATPRTGSNVLGKALPFLKVTPVVGTVLSAGAVAAQTAQGADPRTATSNTALSGAFGYIASATVAISGGPVTASVGLGTLIGAGSGLGMNEWGPELDNMAEMSGDSDAPTLTKPGIANDLVPDWLKPWESK